MSTRDDLKKFVRKYGKEFQNVQTARLGRLDGVTAETGTPGLLWARQWNGKEIKVINRAFVPSTFDLRVLVGSSAIQPSKWFILLNMEDYLTPATGGQVAFHHTQHEFGGSDEVALDRKQIKQLTARVSDAAGQIVKVYGGTILTVFGLKTIKTQTVDLSSYVPAEGAIYSSIISDSNGALRVETGTGFAAPNLGDPSYIAIPGSGEYLLAVVLLYPEQTELLDENIICPMPAQSVSVGTGMQYFNVHDYGATGDGSTDDTSAINAAIAAFNAEGSGVLYFPHGNYLVSSGLTAITAVGIVLGDGMANFDSSVFGSRISCSSGSADLFTINSKYLRFETISMVNTAGSVTAGSAIKITSSDLVQRVDYSYVHIRGFYIGADIQVGWQWVMDGCEIFSRTKYGVKIQNTVNADAGDWQISNTAIYCEGADADAGVRLESSGGGKIVNTKINMGLDSKHFNHGIDIAGAGTTSILLIANTSIENISTNCIHATGNWDYIVINGCEMARYTSGNNSAIYFDGPDHFIIDDCVLLGNSPSTSAPAIDLNNCTYGSIGMIQTRWFASDISQTSCSNITIAGSASPATTVVTETSYAQSDAVGTSENYAREDHTHGTPATPVTSINGLTGDVIISTSGGAGQVVNLARWVSGGGTVFELPDVAEDLLDALDNGAEVDPLIYSLSSDRTQLVFDSAITAGHIVTSKYVVAQV